MSAKETSLSYTSIMTENNDNHQPPNYGATNSANNNNNEHAATSSSPSAQVVLLPPSPKPAAHLSTYTAGEDAGRLATMAKEFGLSRVRPPRNQIREKVPDELSKLNLSSLKYWYERMVQLDTSFLEMRIKSVYIRDHDDDDDEYMVMMKRRAKVMVIYCIMGKRKRDY